jgi:23S rRNA pseudouridine2605 synthase
LERLQKVMAQAGVASRRASEDLIRQGRVCVNGDRVMEPGLSVDPSRDRITVDGKIIATERHVYYLLHKPVGYLSTAKDEHGRRTVLSLVPTSPRIYPVGRLDYDTSGLLLLTNDGDLAYAMTHPKFLVPRVYVATLVGEVGTDIVSRLLSAVELDDGPARADRVVVLRRSAPARLEVELHEGRNRVVRRMFEAIGHPVQSLLRQSFGPLRLGKLAPGQWRTLTADELKALRQLLAG